MFDPFLFTSMAKEVVECVPPFSCSEYFHLHYLGTPGNFESIFLKDTSLLSTLIPDNEVKYEGHLLVFYTPQGVKLHYCPNVPGFTVIIPWVSV